MTDKCGFTSRVNPYKLVRLLETDSFLESYRADAKAVICHPVIETRLFRYGCTTDITRYTNVYGDGSGHGLILMDMVWLILVLLVSSTDDNLL